MSDITPTLTPQILDEILELIEKKFSPTQISKKVNIPLPALKDIFLSHRRDRLLEKAEQFSESILDLDIKKFNSSHEKALRLKQAEASFIRSTLGKDQGYSSRSELTGAAGGAIQIKEIVLHLPTPNVPPAPTSVENKDEKN